MEYSVPSNIESLRQKYPLHFAVWENDVKLVADLLNDDHTKLLLEQKDPRGRTPLMLAVTLGFVECAKLLLSTNANVNIEDSYGFNAVSSSQSELVERVLERRDVQRYTNRVDGIPNLLSKIRDTPDFYVEMKWEFTSWVPLVSRMCPSDTYKIYKSGANVRIDTTLLGFDHSNWQRGSRSFIFKGQDNGAVFMEVDHDLQQVHTDTMKVVSSEISDSLGFLRPSQEIVKTRLSTPTTVTYIDTDKINFERSKTGFIGFRNDRSENVNGYNCKVFTANNVEVVTKTRTEHLSNEEKAKYKEEVASRLTPFHSLFGMVEVEDKCSLDDEDLLKANSETNVFNPFNITAAQYFDSTFELEKRDIGKLREITTKLQRFKANLWLCEDYPLSLPEQVLPIVDLMAISSSHFAKLRDFITLQLPTGFPVKIEIPLFHVLNARITFGNIFSFDEDVLGVTAIKDDTVAACVLEDSCFEPPHGYRFLGNDELRQWNYEEEDELMQMAMRQYMLPENSEDQVTLWEALRNQPEADLQSETIIDRAIQESLQEYNRPHSQEVTETTVNSSSFPVSNIQSNQCANEDTSEQTSVDWNYEIQLAIRLSEQQKEAEDKQRQKDDEILEQVLKLSLTEK
ncbi:ankyrin repeat domain-containing protein 13D-like protein [Leptotrombidium deliense]|uniref:Ankyrin repeat domain-containing protein 13D-like protein n=1 Tax=Leptotrombidium deliense TaxID=299467 RepID=A0A443SCW3_9ACAR|nr:ankyrin repeat domain-containing protein 13D-like protein [Leptotrombidium deliense]